MKKILPIALVALALSVLVYRSGYVFDSARVAVAGDSVIAEAFESKRNDLQVHGVGWVDRVLSDDNEGSRHQRFILRLESGQTLLVAHNIDLAPRIPNIQLGDIVEFYGEYEWNAQGGVIHWTHRDPAGNHIAGWLKHKGTIYQ